MLESTLTMAKAILTYFILYFTKKTPQLTKVPSPPCSDHGGGKMCSSFSRCCALRLSFSFFGCRGGVVKRRNSPWGEAVAIRSFPPSKKTSTTTTAYATMTSPTLSSSRPLSTRTTTATATATRKSLLLCFRRCYRFLVLCRREQQHNSKNNNKSSADTGINQSNNSNESSADFGINQSNNKCSK
jgi:hypothetical protein